MKKFALSLLLGAAASVAASADTGCSYWLFPGGEVWKAFVDPSHTDAGFNATFSNNSPYTDLPGIQYQKDGGEPFSRDATPDYRGCKRNAEGGCSGPNPKEGAR